MKIYTLKIMKRMKMKKKMIKMEINKNNDKYIFQLRKIWR